MESRWEKINLQRGSRGRLIQEARREARLTFLLERSRALWIPNCLSEHGPPRTRGPRAGHQAHMPSLNRRRVGKPNPPGTFRIERCHDPSTHTPRCCCLHENPPLPSSPGLAGAFGRIPAPGRRSRPVGRANVWGQTSASRVTSFSLSCRDN